MIKYITKRILAMPIIMILVSLILFSVILLLPVEQRVELYLPSGNPHIPDDKYEELLQTQIERFGLDKPLSTQYLLWMRNLIKGDWGFSYTWRQPVLESFKQQAPATIELTLFAFIPSVILAIMLGSLAARYQNRIIDKIIKSAAFVSWAVPPFVLGLLLMSFFYARLDWFPVMRLSVGSSAIVNSETFNNYTGLITLDALLNKNFEVFSDALRHLVLPGVTLALVQWALLVRIMRNSMVSILKQDYIMTARAKGISERSVVNLHGRRNAILPVISITGIATSLYINNIVVIETLFSFNGLGRGAAKAILYSDVPVALGFALISCVVTITASICADILYVVVDPRIKLE